MREPTSLPDIEPSLLTITKNQAPRQPPPNSSLVFGRVFSDHMLTVKWTALNGWEAPHIGPYGPLSLEPSSTVFHYAQCLFEGLKAHRDANGKVTLFRPDLNMLRMNNSASRIALPQFNPNALQELILKLVRLDKEWIPQEMGHSLYIRPTMIGTQRAIGVGPPDEALLFVIASPVGPYYPRGFKPVSLYGTTEFVRAAPGGTGAYKLGSNYAPGVVPQAMAALKGYDQNLWLLGPDHLLTEVGTMNIFAVLRKDAETLELVTPPLDDVILPGITRQSAVELARMHEAGTYTLNGVKEKLVVSERALSMQEVAAAAERGTLVEMFGTGTAAVISTVDNIGYLGKDIPVPVEEDGMGPIARALWREITGRQMGTIPSEWSVTVVE